MINFFKTWCEGIIIAVVISIIIESILPEGNNKKYVKVVIGIYIIFTILNPILGRIDNNIDFENILDVPTIETASIDEENIKELYSKGIEATLKENIEGEFGYVVSNVNITYDENYENIKSISLSLKENGVDKIEKVEIGSNTENNNQNMEEYEEVIKYISENYETPKSAIFIN